MMILSGSPVGSLVYSRTTIVQGSVCRLRRGTRVLSLPRLIFGGCVGILGMSMIIIILMGVNLLAASAAVAMMVWWRLMPQLEPATEVLRGMQLGC